uniref:C2H2-type domain-containing protein n=1 Tax=Glossina morsitans morsitans TaxID=37546 RepID=A0A1B0GA90_GLOMM
MELNDYNGFDDHCKSADLAKKNNPTMESSMDQIMQRKDQEFIDHSLLAPEYMRGGDPNNFIIDLINFPKTVNTPGNTTDTLSSDLHFTTALFAENTEHNASDDLRKSASLCIPLHGDFLMPVHKTFNASVTSVETVEENGVKVVQQLLLTEPSETATLDDTSIDLDCDMTRFNSRKVLPHKKRISRKLKIVQDDSDLQLNVPLESHKLAPVQQLVVLFRCELCGHGACSQLEFFNHLKQHYEPSTPDTILAVMKTSLDALGPEKTDEVTNLCSLDKKTDDLDQVFPDVHFPFGNFQQNDEVDAVRVVMAPPQLPHNQHNHHYQHDHPHTQGAEQVVEGNIDASTNSMSHVQTSTQASAQALASEEFSDTEDMLEGIRDKVFVEDTCDTIDLMTPTPNGIRPHWFSSTGFGGIELKAKPFCDVLFSNQFPNILPNDGNPSEDLASEEDAEVMKLTNKPVIATEEHSPPLATSISATLSKNSKDLPLRLCSGNQIIEGAELLITQPNNCEQKQEQELHISLDSEENFGVAVPPVANTIEEADMDEEFIQEKPHMSEENVHPFYSQSRRKWMEDDHKRYVCYKCKRIFNSCNALKYHDQTHTGLRPYQCDICGKSFFAVGALKAHTRTHTGDKPYHCQHCDKKFRQWGDLKYHTVSIHSDEKNHQCEFCGKSFARKYSLDLHRRIHTSERNYKCETCGKGFRASHYLLEHRKIHTGEKPYQCKICSKRFRICQDLRRHERMHERRKLKEAAKKEQQDAAVAIQITS